MRINPKEVTRQQTSDPPGVSVPSANAKTSLSTRARLRARGVRPRRRGVASRVVRDADCAGAVTRLARDAGLALAAGAGAARARATAFAAAAEMARHADALALAVRDAARGRSSA